MKTTVKTDLYTKAILTVIAVFLGILVFQNMNIVTPAHATATPVIVHAPEPTQSRNQIMDVNIVQIGGRSITGSSATIPVEIKSTGKNLPVEVKNSVKIQKY